MCAPAVSSSPGRTGMRSAIRRIIVVRTDEQALIRATQITLRRAFLQNFSLTEVVGLTSAPRKTKVRLPNRAGI